MFKILTAAPLIYVVVCSSVYEVLPIYQTTQETVAWIILKAFGFFLASGINEFRKTTLLSPESHNSNCTYTVTPQAMTAHILGKRDSRTLKSSWVCPSGGTHQRCTYQRAVLIGKLKSLIGRNRRIELDCFVQQCSSGHWKRNYLSVWLDDEWPWDSPNVSSLDLLSSGQHLLHPTLLYMQTDIAYV